MLDFLLKFCTYKTLKQLLKIYTKKKYCEQIFEFWHFRILEFREAYALKVVFRQYFFRSIFPVPLHCIYLRVKKHFFIFSSSTCMYGKGKKDG